MQIDWFTFGAQIVNFLILVALLKKFLYGPIVNAMRQREETIAERLNEAERKRKEAEEQARFYDEKMQEVDAERSRMLEDAREEAEKTRRELIAEARKEVDELRNEWQRAVERERETFLRELRSRAARQVTAVSRRVLGELADAELERRAVAKLFERLAKLDDEQRREIAASLGADGEPLVVRTHFEVDSGQQETIRERVQQEFGVKSPVTFRTDPDLICGIELRAGGHKLAWSVEEFLESLEEEFDRAAGEAGMAGEAASVTEGAEQPEQEREPVSQRNAR